ncbi:hypothetical protein K8353_05810 [Burkholderia contaminans]|nr:hypothetical protein [Burkholderia contaminans]
MAGVAESTAAFPRTFGRHLHDTNGILVRRVAGETGHSIDTLSDISAIK